MCAKTSGEATCVANSRRLRSFQAGSVLWKTAGLPGRRTSRRRSRHRWWSPHPSSRGGSARSGSARACRATRQAGPASRYTRASGTSQSPTQGRAGRYRSTTSSTVVASSGGLVVAPAAGEAREAQGQPGVLLEPAPAGGVVGREGQLGGEHLEHQAGLEPHVGVAAGVDPGAAARPGPAAPAGPGSAASSASEKPVPHLQTVWNRVGGRVVGGQQQRAVHPGAAAPAGQRADHDQVEGVGQLGAVVALELDPQPAAGAGLVAGGRGRPTCTSAPRSRRPPPARTPPPGASRRRPARRWSAAAAATG